MVGAGDSHASTCTAGGAIRVLPGARRAEDALFEELEDALERRDGLTPPLRIVVPSRSLRDHLSRALLRRRGVSTLGVSIQSHIALALEALERLGRAPAPGQSLAAVLARRAALASPRLAGDLGRFSAGADGARASIRDLQDAGLRPAHLEAALECLGAPEDPRDERVAALLRAAADVVAGLEAAGAADAALLLEGAAAALWETGAALLPSAGLWIYGVADATGALADWIDALLSQLGGRLLLSQPPDLARPGELEHRYSDEFIARLVGRGVRREAGEDALPTPPNIRLLRAVSPAAEAEAVAERVRALLDRGVEAEEIAICARRFDAYRGALPAALERWAIPFSSLGLGSGGGAVERTGAALWRLLEEGGRLEMEDWCALDPRLTDDERTGFHLLGLVDLEALAAVDADLGFGETRWRALPVRRRLDRARGLDRGRVAQARDRARVVLDHVAGWPDHAPAAGHAERLGQLLDLLGWRRDEGPRRAAAERLDAYGSGFPETVGLAAAEWRAGLRDALARGEGPEPGGRGAGVQVLSAVAVRERCFDHLFLMGLGRDVFPRPIADDPLFPEELRWRLRAVLPDLPVKRRGHDEERHLFAGLLTSADDVTLSRSLCTAAGREWPESPLLLRLRMAVPALDEDASPPGETAAPLADSAALDAALARDEAGLSALLPEVVATRQRETAALCGAPGNAPDPARVAGVLGAVWRELDLPPWAAAERSLGPYYGWIGPPDADAPPPFITVFADLLRCPWKRFLERELRLAPPPDAGALLPAPDPRALGKVLHDVLERVAETSVGAEAEDGGGVADGGRPPPRALATRLAAPPRPLQWPDEKTLQTWVFEAAEACAQSDGVRAPHFAHLLAESAAPALARARALDAARRPAVYGAELDGVARVRVSGAAAPRDIRFRADRAEAGDAGAVLVEFKSGACFVDRASDASRRQCLADGMPSGQGVQLPAYLGEEGVGSARLVFIGDTPVDTRRETALGPDDSAVAEAFAQSAERVWRALDRGLRPPRLLAAGGEREGEACRYCEMRPACLQGDSAQLSRLRERGLRSERSAGGPDHDALRLLDPDVGATR